MQPPLSLIGLLAHHSYKRDIFPLAFAFFYSVVIKTKKELGNVENVVRVTTGVTHLLLRPPVPAWAKPQNPRPNRSDQNGEEGQEKGQESPQKTSVPHVPRLRYPRGKGRK